MNPNIIQFACGHCKSWLTVPAHLAGVAGPCPKCGQHIVSPRASEARGDGGVPQSAPRVEPTLPPLPSLPPVPAVPQPAVAPSWPGLGANHAPSASGAGPVSAPQSVAGLYPPAPEAGLPAAANWGGLPVPAPGGGLPPQLVPSQSTWSTPETGAAGGSLPVQALPRPATQAEGIEQRSVTPSGLTSALPPGGLSRPGNVVGSRLSLLARQLATPADGQIQLPPAPEPMSADQVRGGPVEPPPTPNQEVQAAAAVAMAQQAVNRGMGATAINRSKGRGRAVVALTFLVLVGGLAYVGWMKREPILQAFADWRADQNAIPVPVEIAPDSPRPGVDKAVEPSATVAGGSGEPSAAPNPLPTPTSSGGQIPVVDAGVADAARVPSQTPAASDAMPTSVPPAVPPSPPEPVPAAPKALLVEEEEGATGLGSEREMTNPVTTPGQRLVEVGRAPEGEVEMSVRTVENGEAPAAASLGQPKVVGVPDEARPALDGLLRFLAAKSWDERLNYSMLPEQVAEKGRAYYAATKDGPIQVDEIHYLRHENNPQVGRGMHAVFVLFHRNWDFEIPVMVEVENGTARVDWVTFVEFKDDMLSKFMADPTMEGRWRFHVALTRAHYFDDDVPDRKNKDAFEVAPPMPTGKRMFAFTDSKSQLARKLATTITWDKMITWAIVELEWRKDDGKSWVELTAVPQLNWYSSAGNQADAASAAPGAPTALEPAAAAGEPSAPNATLRSTAPLPRGR